MKKNYFYNLLLTVFNLVIPVISFPYVARILGPEGVGKVQFTLTLSQYIALIAALGIPIYGVREVARVKHSPQLLSRTLTELILVNLFTSVISFAAFMGLIYYHPFFQRDFSLFAYSSILILWGFTSIDWLYSGLEAFKRIAIRSIIVKVLSLAMILLFVKGKADTKPYLFISMFSVLANNAVNIWSVRKKLHMTIKELNFKRHLKPLLFIFGTTIASTLYTTFDSIILGFMSGNTPVGLYTAATKLTKIAIPIVIAYGAILVPVITKNVHDGDKAGLSISLNRSYAYIIMLSVPLCTGLFVFAPSLISFFSGRAFTDAVLTMRIMSFLPFLIGLGYFWGYQVILPIGKDKLLMLSAIFGMIVSISLNFLLVPFMHENGAAIANVAAEVVVTISYFMLIRSSLSVSLKHAYLYQAALSSAPFLLFSLVRKDFLLNNELLSLAVGSLMCIIVYIGMQILIFKNDVMLPMVTRFIGRQRTGTEIQH